MSQWDEAFQCDCTPGSDENGWHEAVGPNCYERELKQWRELAEKTKTPEYQDMVERMKREQGV